MGASCIGSSTLRIVLSRLFLTLYLVFTWLRVYCVLCCTVLKLSRVQLFATLWTVACQAPLSMRFSRQEYWSGLPCPLRGCSWSRDQTHVSYISCIDRQLLYHQHHHSSNRVSPVFLWWLLQTSQGRAILLEAASFPLQGFCPPSHSVQSLPLHSPQSPSPHPQLNPLSRLLSMAYRLSLASFSFKIKISFILNTHFNCCPLSLLHSFPNLSPPRLSLIPFLPHAQSSVSSSLALVQTHQGHWQHSFQALRWPPAFWPFWFKCSHVPIFGHRSSCKPSPFLIPNVPTLASFLLLWLPMTQNPTVYSSQLLLWLFETLLFSLGRLPLHSLIHSWI